MTINATAHSWQTSLAWSAVFRAAGLFIFGFIGWLWFFSADDSAWKAVSLAEVLVLAALVGGTWYLPRARAERRWRAALDRYAKQEQTKRSDHGETGGVESRVRNRGERSFVRPEDEGHARRAWETNHFAREF